MIRDFPLGEASTNLLYNAILEPLDGGKPGLRFR